MAKAPPLAWLVAAGLAALGECVSKAEEARAVNTGVSIMLLGSVGFMMGLFYLVNQKDNELRKYSWMVISATISIFSAVLLFQAVNGVVEAYVLGEHPSELFELCVSMAHFLAWFLLLQVVLGMLSGARLSGQGAVTEEDRRHVEHNLKMGGILLGHLVGFAAINAFGVLQSQLPRNFPCTFLCFPITWACIYCLSRMTQAIRTSIALKDGTEDECEKSWDEEAAETENDVTGLAVSFMMIQALRLLIGGTLPNPEGEEPELVQSSHSDEQDWLLCTVGLMFVFLGVFQVVCLPCKESWLSERLLPQMKNIMAMDYAWCIFFSSRWFVAAHFFKGIGGMMQEITVALWVTSVALALIFILDKIEDIEASDLAVSSACRAVIQAISVLIGFSWEKAFDTAVADFTKAVTLFPHPLTQLVLAVLLALLVVPAWRLHILPCVLAFEEEEEEEEEEAMEAAAEGVSAPAPPCEGSPATKPLLSKAALKKSHSMVGMDAPTLQRKCLAYKAQIRELQHQLASGASPAGQGPDGTIPDGSCPAGQGPAGPVPASPSKLQCSQTLQRRNGELEERNKQLEAALSGISHDLADLQTLASVLAA